MPTSSASERLARRIADLYATDPQFADARPDPAITAALEQPGQRLFQLVRTVMEGYAHRPALGARAVDYVTGPTGRTTSTLLPRYETVSYGELYHRLITLVHGLTGADSTGLRPGERICILGFTSIDYTTIALASMLLSTVAVPLQTSAPVAQLRPIVAETKPALFAVSVESLEDAVAVITTGHTPARLLVFDYHDRIDDHREAVQTARRQLIDAGLDVIVETLTEVLDRGRTLPPPPAQFTTEVDPLALLIYTSGSTGAPKGAMYPERLVANFWRTSLRVASGAPAGPSITLNFMPMSHAMGPQILYGTLGNGGTAYFAAKSDLSTLLEDLALVRPTQLNFVPRIWDLLFEEFQSEVARRSTGGSAQPDLEVEVMTEQRLSVLGGRFASAATGSAPITAEMRSFVESYLDLHLAEGYGSTEVGIVSFDGRVRRPPVTDYKLVDVPELGYFTTDHPHPRGELLVKSHNMTFPGYYRRPELTAQVFDADGFYRTGDIVVEAGPDRIDYLDRRNNVLKLSQGEFVAVSKLEAAFGDSPLVAQSYVYGNSARPYLLAVIVPTEAALSRAGHDLTALKPLITASIQAIARDAGLQTYEIPRDILIETTPFTLENGLLTGIRKLARPQLQRHYGPRLEQLYTELADGQTRELSELRERGAQQPVLDTVGRAARALLGAAAAEITPDAHFTDLGGDSLSALTFANLLHDIFDVEVPVGDIVSPASDLAAIADYIQTRQQAGAGTRPNFATVHGRDATTAYARDLALDAFIDPHTLAAAPTLPGPGDEIRTVLLTGASGFLGRYLALQWLQRMDLVGGTVICLIRARDDQAARARLDAIFDSGDAGLLAHYRMLADKHLQVLAGDKSEANLGLPQPIWQRLADTVDLIVDPAALVNHVLPYSQLFGPNVVGTAELIRLAVTTKRKQFAYVSTIGVGAGVEPLSAFTEDADIRTISPVRTVDASYANGYGNSKWAGEVLLREAHDRCGLPVSVFRCDMILADTTYVGQLNVPDMFTRLMLSLVATGIAPGSFYELGEHDTRQRAHYDALPVDFIADAISTLAQQVVAGFQTYHVMNPYDDGIGLDEYVDWLVEAGYSITRITDYDDWFRRFDQKLRALPDHQRQASLLPLLHGFQHPDKPLTGAMAPADRFRAAVQHAKIGPAGDIPHITASIIVKYVTNLQRLGLLDGAAARPE